MWSSLTASNTPTQHNILLSKEKEKEKCINLLDCICSPTQILWIMVSIQSTRLPIQMRINKIQWQKFFRSKNNHHHHLLLISHSVFSFAKCGLELFVFVCIINPCTTPPTKWTKYKHEINLQKLISITTKTKDNKHNRFEYRIGGASAEQNKQNHRRSI